MKRIISVAFLAVGISCLIMGIVIYISASTTTMYQLYPVTPNDNATYMLIGGVVATLIGLVRLALKPKAS